MTEAGFIDLCANPACDEVIDPENHCSHATTRQRVCSGECWGEAFL